MEIREANRLPLLTFKIYQTIELIYTGLPWFHKHLSNIVLNNLGPFQLKTAMFEIKKKLLFY